MAIISCFPVVGICSELTKMNRSGAFGMIYVCVIHKGNSSKLISFDCIFLYFLSHHDRRAFRCYYLETIWQQTYPHILYVVVKTYCIRNCYIILWTKIIAVLLFYEISSYYFELLKNWYFITPITKNLDFVNK